MASLVKSCVSGEGPTGWVSAVRLLVRWLGSGERVDRLMAGLPASLGPAERARCQHLVFGVVRHAGRLESALGGMIAHRPRSVTRAILLVAGFELIDAEEGGEAAKIVHHAVGQAKSLATPAEARLVNAVVRKLAAVLSGEEPPPAGSPAEALAHYFSHPPWLVRRWIASHGAEAARFLLEWDQRPAPVYARWRSREPVPRWLAPTRWPGFFDVPRARWDEIERLLSEGAIYLQDPSTRVAVDLLAPLPGETVLDLCAAPGGKTLLIADRMACAVAAGAPAAGGRIVALDLPGERIGRLRENLALAPGVAAVAVAGNLMRAVSETLRAHGAPCEGNAVLVDAPCSNTGVIRRRADVKWRLKEDDVARHARRQLALLLAAARLVAPGGRLVYSTCSVEPEENREVADAFVEKAGGRFALKAGEVFHPRTSGHDGGGAFLFVRT